MYTCGGHGGACREGRDVRYSVPEIDFIVCFCSGGHLADEEGDLVIYSCFPRVFQSSDGPLFPTISLANSLIRK